jgi:pimeloyl-ACP methyl ester carboxylesterase
LIERIIDTEIASIAAYASLSTAHPGRPLIVAIHGGCFTARYFDSPGFSLREMAAAEGFGVILLDRPGYGKSRCKIQSSDILHDNMTALSEAIGTLWREYGAIASGIYLVGHSIGGALALMMSAAARDWPLAAVAVSGIGDMQPEAIKQYFAALPDTPFLEITREMLVKLFFAPGAASEAALDSMGAATVPAIMEEVRDIYGVWMPQALATLGAIREPVQFIFAEFEVLWQADAHARARVAAALDNAARRDVRIFPGVGHCIDFHPEGRTYHRQILDFA